MQEYQNDEDIYSVDEYINDIEIPLTDEHLSVLALLHDMSFFELFRFFKYLIHSAICDNADDANEFCLHPIQENAFFLACYAQLEKKKFLSHKQKIKLFEILYNYLGSTYLLLFISEYM